MKKVLFSFLFMGALATVQAQTADEVVAKHIEAIGGKDKLAAIKTLVREGAISVQGMDLPLKLSVEQDKGFRFDINVMGTAGYQIYTPTAGWNYMPFQGGSGVEEVPADKLQESQDNLDVQGELFNYAQKGHTIELQGKEKTDGVDCYKLKVNTKYGLTKTYFIDATTYYINKIKTESKNSEGKNSEITYGNYKKNAEGYVFAHTMTRSEGEVSFEKITVNEKLADGIFKPAQ
ncbi:MAG: hypothetical protein JNM68_12475 [Dinghuibacter sp.]|nr:hypothetical protein [Dinghuibacter sp.]